MSILGEEPIIVRRTAPGSRVAGAFVPGAVSLITNVQASWQPLAGVDATTATEAERSSQWVKLYTVTRLVPVAQRTGTAGDRVEVDGEIFEVRNVKRQRSLIPHYRVEAVEVQEGGS